MEQLLFYIYKTKWFFNILWIFYSSHISLGGILTIVAIGKLRVRGAFYKRDFSLPGGSRSHSSYYSTDTHSLNREGKRIAEGEIRTVSVYGTDRTESSRRLSINVKAHTCTCISTYIEYILRLLRAIHTRTHAYVTPTRTGHRPGIRQRGWK